MDFAQQSFTLMAGKSNSPLGSISQPSHQFEASLQRPHVEHVAKVSDVALICIFLRLSVKILRLPVEEMKRSISETTLSTVASWKPFLHACRARKGSQPAMSLRVPAVAEGTRSPMNLRVREPRRDGDHPSPTSPHPETN